MDNLFPSFGKFEAMNTQSATTLYILLLMVVNTAPSHAFHLPARHSNTANTNSTDSDDFHHRFHEDTHSENSTQSYQYDRLSNNSTGNVYESTNDTKKEDYNNYTVHIVSPLVKLPNIQENAGNMKSRSEHQMMRGNMAAIILDPTQEEAKELSQHNVLTEIPHIQKQENRPDKNPLIVTYKNDIQRKETDTSTKLLTLEQRIAAYLLQNKHQYLPNSPKDKKAGEKKEVTVNRLSTNMGTSEEQDGNTKVDLRVKIIEDTNLKPQSRDNKFQKNVKEIVNTKLSPKYDLYDDIGKDDIRTDHVRKDDIVKGVAIKDEIRKEEGNNKDKHDPSTNSGNDGSTKDEHKMYDYDYDSERRQVTGSIRPHYDYDDKSYVTEDATDDKEDKHKSKDSFKGQTEEKLHHDTEIFHETGSFHTVENFVEENKHSQKQQLARLKTKPGSKDSDDNKKGIAVSAFKARLTRGEEDGNDDKRSVDMKQSTKIDQQSDISSLPGKDKDHNGETGDNKEAETGVEGNKQFHTGDALDPTGPTVSNFGNESLPKKDQFSEKPLPKSTNTTLEVQNIGTEHTSPEHNSNEMDKQKKDTTERGDKVKTLTRSELSNEATDQKALSNADNVDEVNSALKYKTDNDLPITDDDAKQTSNENTTQENLQPPGSDSNELDANDLNKSDAQPKAYLAVWASTASKNTTHSNVSSISDASSPTSVLTVKGNTLSSAGDNKTLPQVNLRINETNQDNKTFDNKVMGNITGGLLNIQNEHKIESVNNNTALGNEQMQNASKTSEDRRNKSNNASNVNMNGNTNANSHGQTRNNSTSSNNGTHIERKMEINVNKLKVTTETVALSNRTHTDSKMEVNVNKLKATTETVDLNNRTHTDSKMEVDVNKLKTTPETVRLNNSKHVDSKIEVSVNKLKATTETTNLNNRTHADSKMETNVKKLTATPEADGLKLVPSETIERATSSRKAISQINEYQKVPDQLPLFDAPVTTLNNINSRKQNTKDILLETNTTSSTINISDKSQLYKNNQSTTQTLNLESSNQSRIFVETKETNNASIIEKGLSIKYNSSKEDTNSEDNKKERNLYHDNLNSTTYSRNLSDSAFIKINISSLPHPDDKVKIQSNSSTDILEVSKIDNKLQNINNISINTTAAQNNNNISINTTAAQTSKFKVESLVKTTNQSEAGNIKQEQEIRIENSEKLPTATVHSAKLNVPSKKSTPANNNTLKNSKADNIGDSLQVQKKADTKTKLADKIQDVVASLPVSHKSNATISRNQGNNVDTTNERKNNVSVNSSPRPDSTSLDSNNRNYTDKQQNDNIYVVSHFTNGSNDKMHASNKTVGLNVPRKLLSISELEINENKSNKTMNIAHKIENNVNLTGKASNTSKMSASKVNKTSDKHTATVKINKGSTVTENILKNGSRINTAVKAENVTGVNIVHHQAKGSNTSLKQEAIPESSRTEQNISVNRTIQDKNKPQNISSVQKSKESDPVVKITFTVKKNGSNPRNEGLPKNATSNSFHEKAGLQPEVMANERHQQQKSQNQKLEPDILAKGEIVDRVDLKTDASSNKDGISSRMNNKEDNDKIKISNNNGSDGEEEIDGQQLTSEDRNDNEKGENNDNKTRNKSNDNIDENKNRDDLKKNEEESDTKSNGNVQQKHNMDESKAVLDQEISTEINQKNSDLRGDKQAVNIDAKQIHNNDKTSSNKKATTIEKDISQDVDSATTNDMKPPEAGVESRPLQNEADAKSDDVIDDVSKTDNAANVRGLSSSTSAAPSDKIPDISPYKVQDFSLLKPTGSKSSQNKDKNKADQVKGKSPPPPAAPAAASANILKNSSTEGGANASSNLRSECLDASCVHDPGVGVPRGAQAAVSAVLTTHFGPTKDQMIPFDLELLDLADNYDNTTGMFICTIPGTYVISLYLMSHPGAKVNARVLINNRPIAALWADDAKNAGFYPSSSTQTIAQLAFGDQVYVMLVDGGYGDSWVHANYNVFTIFLLYEQMF